MNETQSADHKKAAGYFDRKGQLFDSLYSVEKSNIVARFINKRFRRDIYERYLIAISHIRDAAATSVLDVGVGGARYAGGYLDAGVRRVVGIDISKTMLELAGEYVRQFRNHEKIFEFVFCDIDQFETDESFDIVVAMGFFDYITNPFDCLSKLRALCNHSVIASFPSTSWWRTPLRKLRYRIKTCPVFFFTTAEIELLANQAGFSSCKITKIRGAGMDYVAILRK